jgi:hypothetical protein
MVKLRVFLSDEAGERVRDIAMSWDTSASLVMRMAIEDFLAHPEREVAILGPLLGTLTDSRTDAQREAGERAIAAMLEVDLEAICTEMAHPPQGTS